MAYEQDVKAAQNFEELKEVMVSIAAELDNKFL